MVKSKKPNLNSWFTKLLFGFLLKFGRLKIERRSLTPIQKRMWKAWSALREENNKHKEVPNSTEEDGEQKSDSEDLDFTLSKGMHFCHSYLCNFACHIFNIFHCSHDISTKSIFDISCSSNFLSKIYQPILFLIYLARVITWARYINQSHFRYILLIKFGEQDISTNPIFDMSRSRNSASDIYNFFHFFIYLAWKISQARYTNFFHFLIYLAREISRARYINF